MPSPQLVNRYPVAGDTDVDAEGSVRVSLRDQDTAVAFESMYLAVLYARAVYAPEDLPTEDAVLNDADDDIEVAFTAFDDTGASALPRDPADQSIETVGGDTVYRVTRPDDDDHEGFLYISDVISGSRPFGAEVTLTVDTVIPGGGYGSYPYVPWSDFTGVMLGFVYWPRSTGIFVFFRDDGVDKSLSITGPAEDGTGARTSLADVVFDWSADTYTYRFCWDETPGRRLVSIFAVSSDGATETLLHEVATTALDPFLDGVSIGGDKESDPPARAAVIVGTDGPSGDSIDVYRVALHSFGGTAVQEGLQAGNAEATVLSSDAALLDGTASSSTWSEDGEATTTYTGAGIEIERDVDAAADVATLRWTEPRLASQEWIVIAKLKGSGAVHPATYDTGMGIMVEDGERAVTLSFYDDFDEHDIGLWYTGAGGSTDNYDFPAEAVEWEDDQLLVLHGSSSRNLVRGWNWDDEEPVFERAYDTVTPASTDTQVSVGFVTHPSGVDTEGTVHVDFLWLLPVVDAYETEDGTYPQAQGWTRTTSGTTQAFSDGYLVVDADAEGAYDIYSIESSDYATTAGVTLFFRLGVASWTDSTGATSPTRRAIGPVAMAKGPGGAVLVYFAKTDAGVPYVFIPGEDVDQALEDVLNQTAAGRAMSAQVDFEDVHAYILVARPSDGIRLYVDYDIDPVVSIPWDADNGGFSLPSAPSFVPAGAYAAFGSLDEDQGVQATYRFFRASLGRGYDIVARPVFSDAELAEHVYESEALVIADFEDS